MPIQNTVFIFGAGASYDVIGSHTHPNHRFGNKWRPPLTAQLLRSCDEFDRLMEPYGALGLLAGDIRRAVEERGMGFEDFMVELRELSKTNPLRHRQLIQLRFYLRELLNGCSNRYVDTGNQYGTLAGRLLDIKGEAKVTFVSFNYDTLIEQALIAARVMPSNLEMDSYINGEIPLIKPHGSTQWVYRLNAHGEGANNEVEWILKQYPKAEPDVSHVPVQIDEVWNNNRSLRYFEDPYVYYPALAIPVNQKTEFLYPSNHIQALENALSTAKHVVAIGWRGNEDNFCKLLAAHCPTNRITLHVVNADNKSAQEISDRLRVNYINNAHNAIYGSGFSGFLRDYGNSELAKILS